LLFGENQSPLFLLVKEPAGNHQDVFLHAVNMCGSHWMTNKAVLAYGRAGWSQVGKSKIVREEQRVGEDAKEQHVMGRSPVFTRVELEILKSSVKGTVGFPSGPISLGTTLGSSVPTSHCWNFSTIDCFENPGKTLRVLLVTFPSSVKRVNEDDMTFIF
ncbi:hypothetical protein STEG23_001157, partial [Scotinomys teguina]